MGAGKKFLVVSTVLLWSAAAAGAQERTGAERIGKVHFPVSCGPAAQEEFNRGVAMFHSFWFDAAGKAFATVIQLEPGCAMGHWGAALTHLMNPNPFVGVPTAKGLQDGCPAVERAKAAGAKTPREGDYIAALEALCKDRDKADQRARVLAYEQALGQLSAR